jgi:hypothetical protein
MAGKALRFSPLKTYEARYSQGVDGEAQLLRCRDVLLGGALDA